jgi:hypothetical protein
MHPMALLLIFQRERISACSNAGDGVFVGACIHACMRVKSSRCTCFARKLLSTHGMSMCT